MGSLFRSEEMALCQLFIQSESAYACVSELGELGLVQFRDLNPEMNAFQRKFVNEVRRCDEMERKLRYMEKEIKKNNILILDTKENPKAPQPKEMINLEAMFEKLENELREVNQNAETLKRNFLELTELKYILRKTQIFFEEAGLGIKPQTYVPLFPDPGTGDDQQLLMGEEGMRPGGQHHKLGFVTGVVHRERVPAFERMLWRACRGNVYLRMTEIECFLEDPTTGNLIPKVVFIIFFQGEQLKIRVKKICEGFRATVYPCPDTPADRRDMAIGVMTRIEDLKIVLGQTQDHRLRVLTAAAKHIRNWFIKVGKIKAIYHTLNSFNLDVTQKCLIAEFWEPLSDENTIQQALRRGSEQSGSSIPPILNRMDTFEEPPTYNRTNKFTAAFQALIDAYGVANYREVNPAPFTIITFPFLFAIMFGDFGHGTIMFLFATWMVINERYYSAKKSNNEIWNIFFGGRYIILLMGLFSIYTGFIYNDIFSKSVNIFGSSWMVVNDVDYIMNNTHLELDPKDACRDSPYSVGMDPVWQLAENKIRFLNAYKMKISIIFGVIHMLFGVVLSIWNYTYYKKTSSIFTMFLPQVIFLMALFFYLVVLIFIKWVLYGPTNPVETGPFCAPSILITFINMVMFKNTPVNEPCSPWMYRGQQYLQYLLVFMAGICIPWMLLTKPYLLMKEKKKMLSNQHNNGETETGIQSQKGKSNMHAEEDADTTEMWIHQGIHTIEYVLGSISHTASYLRLWALSLAHGQLAEVLWNMVLRRGLESDGFIGGFILWIVFAFWAILTVGILVLMEGLSAFLHTLRLHWVEFQSKFYTGTGYSFMPFSFEAILDHN
ncbi:LOW QUALITY PROTEIN: V-type proton ATPase 116 kDa subunit a1-like [Homalodisca vitripennis]|nr:LOW QUALITY PROTEIN: V-type proton ATPase 116 kDa subunit a1-like [Homalodisca vitripennis]KAG8327047.1 Unc-32p [Homalodisca vitripennis]